ncbi:MAG: hypothetical protein AAGC97_18930, partial [Planctomycetota bacterium]
MSRKENGFRLSWGKTKQRKHLSSQRLGLESLENRIVLAAPQFVSVQPNGGEVLSTDVVDELNVAPRELTVRFDQEIDGSPTSLSGVQVLRDGMPLENVSREKGLLGNTVILRFAETLPDDMYTINVTGALQNLLGESFDPMDPANADVPLDFDLELGTRVSAVVPQPISRDAGTGNLSQALDQIDVYFDSNELDIGLATDPSYYRLILTQDTVTNTDDMSFQPIAANHIGAEQKVELQFASDLHDLAGGDGTFRLRVGTNETDPSSVPLTPITPGTEPGDSFSTALTLDPLSGRSQIIESVIANPSPFLVD